MRLLIIRHAHAEPRDATRWPDDLERPLTPRGVRRARRAARAIARLEPEVSVIFSSPARRAAQTAAVVAEALGGLAPVRPLDAALPGSTWRELLRAIAREPRDATVALVGHEPDLGKLAGALLFGAPAAVPFKKAGVLALDLPSLAAGHGRLRWSFTPRALAALARKRSKA